MSEKVERWTLYRWRNPETGKRSGKWKIATRAQLDENAWHPQWERVEVVPASQITRLEEEVREDERRKLAAFLQEAVDETADMDEPHRRHFFRVKILSRLAALQEGGGG